MLTKTSFGALGSRKRVLMCRFGSRRHRLCADNNLFGCQGTIRGRGVNNKVNMLNTHTGFEGNFTFKNLPL